MESARDLEDRLCDVDRRGYPAYKSLRGSYDLGGLVLSIDHVQGDPFAAPSHVSVKVPAATGRWPRAFFDAPHRKTALEDLLIRRFSRSLARRSFAVGGSGKSGLLATSRPGPEILSRSACEVAEDGTVTARFEAGFPARGRTTDGRGLAHMLLDLVPDCVEEALICDDDAFEAARDVVDLADDQRFIRTELERRGLVAFVADGSILPRASGVSALPMRGAKPFVSPASLRVTLDLPHRGPTAGMGIRRGVTLIVGGGYHGKSTLLRALQEGVYDHVADDGRELVATDASAVKLRAEDGRAVSGVDISLFINNLPDGRDTQRFSTADASGSTSQAASCVEALEAGCRALLVDEDTSATNFMMRDRVMEAVVARDAEPITPFVERMRDLWERAGVSCVLVAGSSGAFFSVADTVIQMDRYEARDVTERVRSVCRELSVPETPRAGGFELPNGRREIRLDGLEPERSRGHGRGRGRGTAGEGGPARLKARSRGTDEIQVGRGMADMRLVEQLVDPEQAAAIAQMLKAAAERGLLSRGVTAPEAAGQLVKIAADQGWRDISDHGEAACGLALPRVPEIVAAINRWRAEP